MSRLPPIPQVTLEVVEDLTPDQPSGFLRLVRRRMTARVPGGRRSEPFVYDEVDRRAIDAVVVAATYRDSTGEPFIYLRSSSRPPVGLRPVERWPSAELARPYGLWELPAGLVEPEENHPEGPRACARRELFEELGFDVAPEALLPLGPSCFPCPGVIAERHYYFWVEVEPNQRKSPTLDGSALEKLGTIVALPLGEALQLCRDGLLEDAKTELGLRRLAEQLRSAR